jgi:hypothetical protein
MHSGSIVDQPQSPAATPHGAKHGHTAVASSPAAAAGGMPALLHSPAPKLSARSLHVASGADASEAPQSGAIRTSGAGYTAAAGQTQTPTLAAANASSSENPVAQTTSHPSSSIGSPHAAVQRQQYSPIVGDAAWLSFFPSAQAARRSAAPTQRAPAGTTGIAAGGHNAAGCAQPMREGTEQAPGGVQAPESMQPSGLQEQTPAPATHVMALSGNRTLQPEHHGVPALCASPSVVRLCKFRASGRRCRFLSEQLSGV